MSRGPSRATLAALAKVLDDDALFADTGDGWRRLVVGRRELALAMGVTVGTIQDRLIGLRNAGLARGNRTVELHARRIVPATQGRIVPVDQVELKSDEDTVDPLVVVLEVCELALEAGEAGDFETQDRALRVIHSLVKSARARGVARGVARGNARGLSERRADLESLNNEMSYEMSTSQLISSSKSARQIRAEPAKSARSEISTQRDDAVPASERGFATDELSWVNSRSLDAVLRPLNDACETHGRPAVRVHHRLLAAARLWPRPQVEGVVELLAGDVVNLERPGGLLVSVLEEGRLRYLPLETSVPETCDTRDLPPEPLAEEVQRVIAEMEAPPEEPLAMGDAFAVMRSRLGHDREAS